MKGEDLSWKDDIILSRKGRNQKIFEYKCVESMDIFGKLLGNLESEWFT